MQENKSKEWNAAYLENVMVSATMKITLTYVLPLNAFHIVRAWVSVMQFHSNWSASEM